jgi:glycogen debranching enzyme
LFDAAGGVQWDEQAKFERLRQELERIDDELGLLSITDIVWNHTANNTAWLQEHPEAGYNLHNSPHLRPAFELDEALMEFSRQLGQQQQQQTYAGVDPDVKTEEQLERTLEVFKHQVFDKREFWQFYVLDVERTVKELRQLLSSDEVQSVRSEQYEPKGIQIHMLSFKERADLLRIDSVYERAVGERYGRSVRTAVAAEFMLCSHSVSMPVLSEIEAHRMDAICEEYRALLNEINLAYYKEYDRDRVLIIENIRNRFKYERLAEGGPRLGPISAASPIVGTYFTRIERSPANQHLHSDHLACANNGWIWNADPLIDFAGPQSRSYFIRELIPWGDCVKLRYGAKKVIHN